MAKNQKYKNDQLVDLDDSRKIATKDNEEALGYYLNKFYSFARGHAINKYHVGMWGDHVEEALRIMDLNSFGDKYNPLTQKKVFHNVQHRHIVFQRWLDTHYDAQSKILNLFWAASKVNIPELRAEIDTKANIDTTKTMKYALVKGHQSNSCTLSMTILDDPYMMWYNFFNALFNTQFSPLVLKPRSTWQKLVIGVDILQEATTDLPTVTSDTYITDASIGQLFEFNSAVLMNSPKMDADYSSGKSYTFNVNFQYPNAFQGSFKERLRFLRNNTSMGVDSATLENKKSCPYGEYKTSFFCDNYETLQSTAWNNQATYEAFQKNVYYNTFNGQSNAALKSKVK